MNLDAYRIFTDEDGVVYLAAKKVGNKIKTLHESLDREAALEAVLEDAGLRVQVLERDMDLGGRSYKPTAEDWR